MADPNRNVGAHLSFPISAPALQSAALRPDSNYFDIYTARHLSASLGKARAFFSAAELSSIGLLGKLYLTVINRYLLANPLVFQELDQYLITNLSLPDAQAALVSTIKSFPTALSFQNPDQLNRYLYGENSSPAARHNYYGSLFLIFLAEKNQAIQSRDGFFTDPDLRENPLFSAFLRSFQKFFIDRPHQSGTGPNLIDTLLEPIRRHPDSLFDQLAFISQKWGDLLEQDLSQILLLHLDHLKEEYSARNTAPANLAEDPLGFITSGPPSSPELVKFSPDGDWMPRVILQAKNAYVWLDQLSKQYGKSISRLDQVPEEELSKIARSGITALWLIGLWERSPASQKIKQLCGNPQAVSSAYSLFDYAISARLGGEEAYQRLSSAAAQHNIKLAADMVPNHMGIDSRWVTEHPDWFLSLDQSPFPSYTFDGVDLSSSPSVSIHLEDHYYNKTDAAVVFKRTDNHSGESLYIYHGNDGTSMPWNDTAQLNFLNPDVREGVIQTILHVARKFPIIRFDAAMTLSKKHYQRLWFPEPGSGGAIPTRSEFGMSKEVFSKSMPEEFWREVVDRVAEEAPDTLLLAEAFWMMEGYFVRNLGMHRVYNSAFMHMLRDEENNKYRQLMLSTLELDPQILKRYVNFMNNPDEDTAISQFGSDGKYFGTCLLMSTLPGLPMFGHGQMEGFTEKYGMEYEKAYYDESPDSALIERHETEIFPLLHKRYLFANVNHFFLYDLVTEEGKINQDVYAYSNRHNNERALIIFHNKWGSVKGRILRSAAVNGSSSDLLSGLGLSPGDGDFLLFTDHITGLEYIRALKDIEKHGLYFDLGAYHYHAFMDFRLIPDQDGSFQKLHDHLDGRGAPNLEHLRKELLFEPLVDDLTDFLDHLSSDTGQFPLFQTESFLRSLQNLVPGIFTDISVTRDLAAKQLHLLFLSMSDQQFTFLPEVLHLLLPWSLLPSIAINPLLSDLRILLNKYAFALQNSDRDLGTPPERLTRDLLFLFEFMPQLSTVPMNFADLVDVWFGSASAREFLKVHEYQNQTYFEQESMETLLLITFAHYALGEPARPREESSLTEEMKKQIVSFYQFSRAALRKSKFIVDNFIKTLMTGSGG